MFDWRWKDTFNFRLNSIKIDVDSLNRRMDMRDRWLSEYFIDITKRLERLEKDNKKLQQLLQCTDKSIVVTVKNCNKS